ncbi:MAG: glycosyltransferase family 2 protein [Patescibacteria group bacterium]|nr:glycosyltransferase family 2 protein [Patescibacteria group bacterium]
MKEFLEKNDRKITRSLEMSTGIISWTLLTSPVWAGFFFPEAIAYFILVFDLYFFYRALMLGINAVRAYRKIRLTEKDDWYERAKEENLPIEKVRHVVFIPTIKDPMAVLERTLGFLTSQEFPTKQIDIVLATEARDTEAPEKVALLKKKFEKYFGHFWMTSHVLVPGEVVGKSSNLASSAKEIQRKIEEVGYDKDFVTITSCDSDVAFHPKYFSNLSYKFLKNPSRYVRFWQAALVFYNNIWRVPMPIRVVHTLYSISQVADLMRPGSTYNYSSYSASWKMVEEAGFWDVDVVSEDWHLFFKCFFSHEGKVDIESIYLPLLADAAEGKNYWHSMVSQYNQNRRWAWGATDIAFAVKQFLLQPKISKQNFTLRFLRALDQHILWPVNWWIVTLGAQIPPIVNPAFKYTALGYNLPKFSGAILTTCTVFLVFVVIVDWLLKPPRPADFKKRYLPSTLLQYLLMPITSFFFSALPGMDAHARLILGKRLEYKSTEKMG